MENLKKKILLVEDTDTLRLITKKLLSNIGYDVLEAVNGKEALHLLRGHDDIVLVLLDIMMPVMDGIEFLEEASEIRKERNIKICMMTAKGVDDDIRECLFKGADDYLIKPIDKDLLHSKISTLLSSQNAGIFTSIETKLAGKILRVNSEIPISIIELSESEVSFYVEDELPVGAKIQVVSPSMNTILKSTTKMILRVYQIEQRKSGYLIKAAFVGLKSFMSKNIRAVTTRGEGIYE